MTTSTPFKSPLFPLSKCKYLLRDVTLTYLFVHIHKQGPLSTLQSAESWIPARPVHFLIHHNFPTLFPRSSHPRFLCMANLRWSELSTFLSGSKVLSQLFSKNCHGRDPRLRGRKALKKQGISSNQTAQLEKALTGFNSRLFWTQLKCVLMDVANECVRLLKGISESRF